MANWLDPLWDAEANHALAQAQELERQADPAQAVVKQTPLSQMRVVHSSIGTVRSRSHDRREGGWRNRR